MHLRFIQVFRSPLYLNSSKKFAYPPSSPSPPSFFFFLSLSIPIFDTEVAEPIEVQKKQRKEIQSLLKKI
jgi:hypothetical protein